MRFLKTTKQTSISFCLLTAILLFTTQMVSAQITITLPKIPKIKKPKIEQPREPETTTSNNQTVQNQTSEEKKSPPKEEYVETDGRILLFLDELKKANKQAAEYTPETKTYLVENGVYEWLLRAVSPSSRNEFFTKWQSVMSPANRKTFSDGLDALNATAAKKLPLVQVNPKNYSFRNAAEEKMLKGTLENLAALKIHKIGLNQANWLIDKNSLGIPTARYKHGLIWVRNTASDHPYCSFYFVNIVQDYAGGGTYGASYGNYVGSELAGCPSGK